ncbi:MAG TPA: ATP-binding cassette domain-containing protein [Bacteroidaceae bacterium]|nr:ATP-binding cassette domain-containing protein [Bacteroidaceae bacterium]
MKEKIIEAKNLTKKYGDFPAVNDISFWVEQGEVFGLLGPNGAGKTTTINMLIGMAKIYAGTICYNGVDLTGNIKKAQEIIGIVADESNLYDEMSGYENLCFCGSLYGLSKNDRQSKAKDLLNTFRLDEAANKKFKAYSKGMKRKLTIAAALIHNPQILFLDEPTSGIDVASARQIRDLIKKLNQKGTTVFLTTHYIEEAERLCDRIAFLNRGKIIRIDTVNNLINESKDEHIIEVVFDENIIDKVQLSEKLNKKFTYINCSFKNNNTIRIISIKPIDISPIVHFLSLENIFIIEAKLHRPSLEDAFVKWTGIEIDLMKKEKEKK